MARFPTGSVRDRAYKSNTIALEVLGLRKAERVPRQLRTAYQKMMLRMEIELVASYKSFVPGGPNGRLGREVAAKRLAGGRVVVGTFNSRFARALNRGFTSTAKKGKALRFEVEGGRVVYAKRVKVAGRHFHEKALAAAGPIVEANYDRFFYDIGDLA